MRTEFDFAPLHRSSIGFDRVLRLLDNAHRQQAGETWPPYDILKISDDDYRISMLVAGYGEGDLDIVKERNVLVIKGGKNDEEKGKYLHRGIAPRSFQRRFELAAHVEVEEASLKDGMLTIHLRREVPEALKPCKIAIGKGIASATALQIEGERQVA